MKRTLLGAVALTTATVATIATTIPSATGTTGTTGTPWDYSKDGIIKLVQLANDVKLSQPAVEWLSADGTQVLQTIPFIVNSQCVVTNMTSAVGSTPAVSDLLQISVTGMKSSTITYQQGDIGAGTGSQCGKVTIGGTIVIKPGTKFGAEAFTSAVPVVGMHNGAKLNWSASLNGTTIASQNNLIIGPSAGGSASSGSDNTSVPITPPPPGNGFDTINLTPSPYVTGGSTTKNAVIDLSPGDSTNATTDPPSTFTLGHPTDYTVDCGNHNQVQATNGAVGSQGAVSATFDRLPNEYSDPSLGKNPQCILIQAQVTVNLGANASSTPPGDDTVTWTNGVVGVDGTSKQMVHAQVTTVWNIARYSDAADTQYRSGGELATAMQPIIEYVPPTSTTAGSGFVDAEWCGALVQKAPSGVLDPTTGQPYALVPDHPIDPAYSTTVPVPWCIISSESHIVGDHIVNTLVWDGVGDPVIGYK